MKGIFITYGLDSGHDKTGVGLKIRNQIQAFCQSGIGFEELTLPYSKNPLLRVLYRLPFYNGYPVWKYDNRMGEADYIYLRRPFVMTGYMRNVLRRVRAEKPNIKIVMEFPTYPYDLEIAHFKMGWLFLLRDRYHRNRLRGIVDRIATLSKDDVLFGIPTIKIQNGINVDAVARRIPCSRKGNEIHLCAVALFKEWHGYERLLFGMADYYAGGGGRNIVLHFAGEGQELPLYQRIVKEKRLDGHVVFHGYLQGEDLDRLYDQADIGISSLGLHRIGLYEISSTLKSREYLARGLPIILSLQLDAFEEREFPYCMYVPQDESAISIENIIEFYDSVYSAKAAEDIAEEIRKYAAEYVGMKKLVEPVVDYYKKSISNE